MTRYVIDAPTLLHLVDHDLTVSTTHQLVAPVAIRSQALQLLLADVRAGRRTDREVRRTHVLITELRMRVLNDRVSRWTAWQLARDHDWDALGEAEYLAVTRLQADALVTVDPALRALAQGVVPLAPLQALLVDDTSS